MQYFELTQDHTKARIKKLRTLVMLVCPNLYDFLGIVNCVYVCMYDVLFSNKLLHICNIRIHICNVWVYVYSSLIC